MKAKRFSEEQIIGVLREAEAGAKTKVLCRRHGISEATFSNWKAKYVDMAVFEARRLKEPGGMAGAAAGVAVSRRDAHAVTETPTRGRGYV